MRFNHHVRLENNPIPTGRRGRHLESITTLFRAVEFLLFLAVISRIAVTFPLNYFRQFALTVINTPFVFVVGNAIVITLLLRSGGKISQSNNTPDPKPETTFILSVYSPSGKTAAGRGNSPPAAEVKINCYRTTKSEKLYVNGPAGERKSGGGAQVLRRTKTGTVERRVSCTCAGHFREDQMSGAEFRRTVEDFIARQQRLLQEEEEANVTY